MPPKVNKLQRVNKPKKQSNIQLQRNTQLQNQKVNVVVNLAKNVGVRKRKPRVNNVPKTLQQPIIKRIIQPTINIPANFTDRSQPFGNRELEYEMNRFKDIQLREERLRKQSDDVPVAETAFFETPVKAKNMTKRTPATTDRLREAFPMRRNFPVLEEDAMNLLETKVKQE